MGGVLGAGVVVSVCGGSPRGFWVRSGCPGTIVVGVVVRRARVGVSVAERFGNGFGGRVAKAQPMTPSCSTAPTPSVLMAMLNVLPTVCLVIGEAVSIGGVGTPE